ncbi:putative transmembrane protein [Apostichopus japonicus]|uniref:Putative transmembrane protein n=1 Tax=Stichopus japonicus TaxID=307972 RepID=A0A2G8L3F8_STIJA|nr:putative transmembrane protein [Apostichopus japonicus]
MAALVQAGNIFVRIAGVSGCIALILGTVWHHGMKKNANDREIGVFENAKSLHMFSTAGLLAVPLTRHPTLVGSLLCAGMILFCGTCYIGAMTGNTWITKVAPYGGMLMMAGWLAMAF